METNIKFKKKYLKYKSKYLNIKKLIGGSLGTPVTPPLQILFNSFFDYRQHQDYPSPPFTVSREHIPRSKYTYKSFAPMNFRFSRPNTIQT